ncbi:MAG: hypothetical protein ABH860_02080, partial [bacterium]
MVISANQINQTKSVNEAEQADNSTIAQELKKIEQLKQLQQQQMNSKAYEGLKSSAKRVEELRGEKGYQAKLQKDPGIKILSNLAKDLAALGMDITPKSLKKSTTGKINDELEQILDKKAVLKEDKYEVSNLTKEAVKRAQGREEEHQGQLSKQQRNMDMKKLMTSSDLKEAVQQYSSAYAQKALQSSPEANEQLKDAQSKLKEKGFSEKDIKILEKAVKRSLDTEFISRIQESFIQRMASPKNAFQLITESEPFGRMFEGNIRDDSLEAKDNIQNKDVQKLRVEQGKKEEGARQLESQQKNAGMKKLMTSSDVKEAVQQYSSAYAQKAQQSSPEASENLKDAQSKLREKGFSEKDIKILEKAVKRSLTTDPVFKPDSFMQRMASTENVFQLPDEPEQFSRIFEENVREENVKSDDVQRTAQKKTEAKEQQLESQQKNVDMKKLMTSSDVKEAVQQYSSAYAQKAQQSSPEANEQLKDAQSKLKEKGFSEKDIKIL